jgi:hypothetical protein
MENFKKRLIIIILIISWGMGWAQNVVEPVRGTWINFVYQDERNKYMNPNELDNTSPELWRLKVQELSEMGVKYVIILFVALEGKSFYPSNFMPSAYPADRESPVEAIMNASDKHGLKVFMSTGWANDMDENPGLDEVKEIQLKIMHETTKLYSGHPSFYGWYLPCEDVVGPYLSQKSVDAVNVLTAEARKVTPEAKVLISPYGLRLARFDDGVFAEQISKLEVDIIAYQDEIGCVVEPMPLPKMKANFMQLRKIHDQNNIELWANNESFTWEKGRNVRPSALIPAPLPRFISQMVGVSQADVEEIISFSVCGIFDKPNSEIPIGQPEFAQKAYRDYMDWKSAKGRWPLLTASFWGTIEHDALNKSTFFLNPPHSVYSSGNLTDGKLGEENFMDKNWLGFEKDDMICIIDLGEEIEIKNLAARFLTYRIENIFFPTSVEFSVSNDGENFKPLKTVQMDQCLNDRYDCWIDIAVADNLEDKARYVRIYAINGLGYRIFADEIFVNSNY